ncbi:MAG: hypothetical protein FRX49_05897 [Trebouxia sp. A1-2]|nr:MAG: hypothetical protein FRX49_05897 [Trebouxia sp. A1-2]
MQNDGLQKEQTGQHHADRLIKLQDGTTPLQAGAGSSRGPDQGLLAVLMSWVYTTNSGAVECRLERGCRNVKDRRQQYSYWTFPLVAAIVLGGIAERATRQFLSSCESASLRGGGEWEMRPTLSTCMAFMSSTKPSRDVFRISGGVCAGNVSLKCADEYNLHIPSMETS